MRLACWWEGAPPTWVVADMTHVHSRGAAPEGLRGRPVAHIGPADELAQDGFVCRDAADEQRGVGVREEQQLARVGRAQRLIRVHDQPHWVRVWVWV